jgi:hypothetical protein
MILNLLTEGIRQTREAPILHPKVKILTLNERSANVLGIGRAKYGFFFDAKTLRGAIRQCTFRIGPENLDKLRIVDIIRERIYHCSARRGPNPSRL